MASFYKRGKTWSFMIDVGLDKDGKRKQKGCGGFRTKKEAEEAAAQLTTELSQGTFVQEKDVTFRDFSKVWLNLYSSQVKKSSTRVRQHEVNNLLYYFDNIKIKDITKKQYQDALLDLPKRGFAENTIAGIHGTARMLFKKAVELDIIKKDPTEYARPPRKVETLEDIEKEDELPKYLEKEDLATFLRMAHDAGLKDDYAIFTVLAYTGIRGGELCALKWSDINFEDHTIKIAKTYYNPNNNIKLYELQPPKTKSSKRVIIVSQHVIKELEKHQARQNKYKMRNRDIWHNENFVFCVDKHPGYPIYLKLIEARMARLLKIAGLNQELTPHSLRHTHTSLLAEAGVGLEEIMERLGHTDDDTTKRVYLHVTKDMKKEAAHKFDELMNSL
ncbi:tyrosine-type recombinase/integrase [Anaeroselena agilis]|uniref:Tyrosine-type recombinase/integrase n=1 Tax=Anaeroselena agilis TaxID=3063788 RepID=A0ABU3NT93_9FIRM|nr:tyrosine-type recombinase/integrase [Selenomonadales bacterium 4137-cl]